MDAGFAEDRAEAVESFIRRIKRQDREDERYLFRTKILPLLIGVCILTILLLLTPVRNPVMRFGCFLVISTMTASLLLFFRDYVSISRESFDATVSDFLKQKEKRLKYWRSTPFHYHIIFFVYIAGVVMMILGNSSAVRNSSSNFVAAYLLLIVLLLIAFWILGERRYRERHRSKHRPLLEMISDLCEPSMKHQEIEERYDGNPTRG